MLKVLPPPSSITATAPTSLSSSTGLLLSRNEENPLESPTVVDSTFLSPPPSPSSTSTSVSTTKRSFYEQLNLANKNTTTLTTTTHKRPLIVGHRGALYQEVENTLEGFQYCAYTLGIDAVELDVFLVANELVVFHGGGHADTPGDLSEYCLNGQGKNLLHLSSLHEIQSLQFNPNCPELDVFHGNKTKILNARIPTLRSVLEALKEHDIIVKIELKGPNVTLPVLALVEELQMQHQCHYSSFHHERIALIRALHPERDGNTGKHVYLTGALFHGGPSLPSTYLEDAKKVGASQVHLLYDDCTTDRIDAIHAAGMTSMAYFRGPVGMHHDMAYKYHVDDDNDDDMLHLSNNEGMFYKMMIATGVDEICCNRPDILQQILKQ